MNADERFWNKVHQRGDSCWIWLGETNRNGYGRFRLNGRRVPAHRWSYEQATGPIPDGLQIDHLCRTPACVNPDHLEAVTPRENTRRGLSASVLRTGRCKAGHEMTPENTYVRSEGWTNCRACGRKRTAAYRARRAAA